MNTEEIGGAVLESWTPDELQDAFTRNEIVVIDVRTPQEFMFEHIDGALLAPLHLFKPANLPGQADKRIVFHCGSGVRSRKVAEACLAAGFDRIAHLDGGFAAWKQARKPYVGVDMASGAPKRFGQG